ncbi:serine hydrolase [Salinimicrobium soli]|uniref:serine hydrolase n=1 Tax=Salinimicrobium soli TaxID=1254399 RepID=UPI003AAAEADE
MMNYTSRSLKITVLFVGAFFYLSGIFAQTKAQKIEELLNKYQEYGQFNGSALVAEDGKIILSKGFGMANMEYDIPNKAETKHRLGSITKQFTATLIMQLVQEGKLELDKPISTYLPDYKGPAADKVTIHHLLTHSSGIPSYTSFPGFFQEYSRDPYSPKEFVKTFADSTLQFAPGEKFEYNNSGYFLLGYIIEKVTGKSYEQALQERIFDPLNMNNTGYDHHANILKNRASGYEKNGNGYVNAPYLDMSLPYAAGSLYSTVEDLYKWDRALYENKILSEESKKLMFSPQIKDGEGYYGYGWMMTDLPVGDTKDSVKVIAHGGGINGFNTLIARFPEGDDLVVLLNNTGGTKLREMTKSINDILHGEDYELPKRSLAMNVLPVFREKGVEAGMKKFKELKADDSYSLNEAEMNRIGYQLLQNGKVDEAIAVFKINVEEFPKSWNVYDSLGEAYMNAGQKEKAVTNYKRSLELNPDNDNGKQMLKQIEGQ